jgi:serine/threonine-protein kinase
MLPALSADPRFERMFLAEASVASALAHPNLCRVLERGDDAGVLYLVMEWVRGVSLAALLEDHPGGLPARVAGRIVLDIARGLAAAHEAKGEDGAPLGIIHRDVSPQNILVSIDGAAKMTDFGIAKIEGGPATQAGFVKGKVRYMSPEQVYCEEVTPRTDVFALGVVLYESTTGKHPFASPNDVATLAKIAAPEEAQPPGDVAPGACPAELERLVVRAVSKESEARHATMGELVRDLEALFGDVTDAEVAELVAAASGARIAAIDAAVERDSVPRFGAPEARSKRSAQQLAVASAIGLAAAIAIAVAARSSAAPAANDLARAAEEAVPTASAAEQDPAPGATAAEPPAEQKAPAQPTAAETRSSAAVVPARAAAQTSVAPARAAPVGADAAGVRRASAGASATATALAPKAPLDLLETRE